MKILKITAEIIADLKKEHGELAQITLGKDTLLFSKPTRQTVSMSMTKAQKDMLDGVETIVTNCYVGGTLELNDILSDVAILMSLAPLTNELIGIQTATLKNV